MTIDFILVSSLTIICALGHLTYWDLCLDGDFHYTEWVYVRVNLYW